MALLEKAAGQGHAHAMYTLGSVHVSRQDFEQAVGWFTMGAEAGLPKAMHCLGHALDSGQGVTARDHSAAAGWFRRAADASNGDAWSANNLSEMYAVGRGRARQTTSASSCSTFQMLVSQVKLYHKT
jgi:TPR repeat protein